jgi:hypothetical protein
LFHPAQLSHDIRACSLIAFGWRDWPSEAITHFGLIRCPPWESPHD